MVIVRRSPKLRSLPLAASLSAALALSAVQDAHASGAPHTALLAIHARAAIAMTGTAALRPVANCLDDLSSGTLRAVITSIGTASGDTVDMHALSCSTITLTHGEIPISQSSLELLGPSDHVLTVTTPRPVGGPYNRLFNHGGTGELTIVGLTLTNGKYASAVAGARGGCIISAGNVYLYNSTVSGCEVNVSKPSGFPPTYAEGGGIYASGTILLDHSTITGNGGLAFNGGNRVHGGGVAAHSLLAYYSTISRNSALGTGGSTIGSGGGAVIGEGNALISTSTFDLNQGDLAGGIYKVGASSTLLIADSTISGNSATGLSGAIYSSTPLVLSSSTIAFNSSNSDAAVTVNANATINSSIIAKNKTATTGFTDLYVGGSGHTLAGAHNLIVSGNFGLPDNTAGDPLLAPLANHGGPTRTHALLATSPARDSGHLVSGVPVDQRGLSRSVGTAPDIGAYERQIGDDEIFYNGFE